MIVVFIGLALMLLKTQSVIAGNYEPPGLEGFNMHSERDGDGIFDEGYDLDDEFHVPECVK